MTKKMKNELVEELEEHTWVIFDLDGTLADIHIRRDASTKSDGKINWDVFFDPANIHLDIPKSTVIKTAQGLVKAGYKIAIFSGRSKKTKTVTREWLDKYKVPYNILKMRPTSKEWMYMPDDKLKQYWLEDLFPGKAKNKILCVFDDRDKVVKMWRDNGITCMQVAEGNF